MHIIPQIHDATLKSIHFSWAEGPVVLELLLAGSVKAALVFSDVVGLNAPRAFEWGGFEVSQRVSRNVPR